MRAYKPTIMRNAVLDGDGFYVSYNADTSGGVFSGFYGLENEGEETALVKDGVFRILKGDWREQYAAAIDDGFDACLAIYKANKAGHNSPWSDSAD